MGKLNMLNWSTLTLVGHTDATGSEAYNHNLSVRRANAVKAYFLSKGLPYEKVQAKGMGESQPIADNSTSAGRAKNRRVEIEVVGSRQN
jgi:OOP family OmpA-OmpF porin